MDAAIFYWKFGYRARFLSIRLGAVVMLFACQEAAPSKRVLGGDARDGRKPCEQGCELVVSFGSACCGPDVKLMTATESTLQVDPRVASYSTWNYGKEGEEFLCVKLARPADAAVVSRMLGVLGRQDVVVCGGR